jgi:hypothetical protein
MAAEGTKHLEGQEGERVVVTSSMGPQYAMLQRIEGSMAVVRMEGEARDREFAGWRVLTPAAARSQGEDI